MPNPIFSRMGTAQPQQNMPTPGNNPFQSMTEFFRQLNEYKNGLSGNPNEILQNAIQSGKIPKDRLDNAIKAARQIRQFIR